MRILYWHDAKKAGRLVLRGWLVKAPLQENFENIAVTCLIAGHFIKKLRWYIAVRFTSGGYLHALEHWMEDDLSLTARLGRGILEAEVLCQWRERR